MQMPDTPDLILPAEQIADMFCATSLPSWESVLPPEHGDSLTRAEFERRYWAMPEVKKAELIEGIVYMPSLVSFDTHARQHATLSGWLSVYASAVTGLMAGVNPSIRLDIDNMPQPDALLICGPEAGG